MLYICRSKDKNIKYISVPSSVLVLKSFTSPHIPLELEISTKPQHIRDNANSKSAV